MIDLINEFGIWSISVLNQFLSHWHDWLNQYLIPDRDHSRITVTWLIKSQINVLITCHNTCLIIWFYFSFSVSGFLAIIFGPSPSALPHLLLPPPFLLFRAFSAPAPPPPPTPPPIPLRLSGPLCLGKMCNFHSIRSMPWSVSRIYFWYHLLTHFLTDSMPILASLFIYVPLQSMPTFDVCINLF